MSRLATSKFAKVGLVLLVAFGLAAGLSRQSEFFRRPVDNRETARPGLDRQTAGNMAVQKPKVSLLLVDSLETNVMTAGVSRVIVPAVDGAETLSFKNGPAVNVQQSVDRGGSLLDMFNLTRGPLVGSSTLAGNKDVVVAVWEGSSANPAVKKTFAWDEPEFNLLVAEVDKETLSPERLKEFLVNTIVNADSGLERPAVWFWMDKNPDLTGLRGVGRVAYINGPSSATLKGYEFDIAAILTGNRAYIAFKIGKLTPVDKPAPTS